MLRGTVQTTSDNRYSGCIGYPRGICAEPLSPDGVHTNIVSGDRLSARTHSQAWDRLDQIRLVQSQARSMRSK
jgi:hypothetical protein